MVVDTSALVALLLPEADADRYRQAMTAAATRRISAFSLFECRIVLLRRVGQGMVDDLAEFLQLAAFDIAPFDATQVDVATAAYLRFGKGSGHPAQLNLGDCAAYALATSLGLPLLYKGGDFAKTDVTPAI
jgi:ribonuclease VapC